MEPGEVLRTLRRDAGLKQNEMAQRIGISPTFLCDIERSRKSVPEYILTKLPNEIRVGVIAKLIADHRAAIKRLRNLEPLKNSF